MKTHQEILLAAGAAAKAAREIAEKAEREGRDMTVNERSSFDAKFTEAREQKAQADAAKAEEEKSGQARRDRDQAVMAEIKRMSASLFGPSTPTGRHGQWAKSAADQITKAMPTSPDGQKALVSGSIGAPTLIDPDVNRVGVVPTSLLDLLPVVPAGGTTDGGNAFTFLRQTVRTNNAAPVADGTLKPTSIYTIAEVEDRFRVMAHLSEPVPLRFFADYANLEDFLGTEMEYGLLAKLEQQIVSGNGTGENFTGILNTSGILSQAFSTDLLTTARKAITQLQGSGTKPSAFVFSPTDCEAFDLLREGTGTGQFLLGGPGNAAEETLWSIPRVASTAVANGTGLLADWSQVELVVREGTRIDIDTGGDLFTKNQALVRVEGRFGLAVKRSAACVKLSLV